MPEGSKEALIRGESEAVMEDTHKEERKHQYAQELKQQVRRESSIKTDDNRWSTISGRRSRSCKRKSSMTKRYAQIKIN